MVRELKEALEATLGKWFEKLVAKNGTVIIDTATTVTTLNAKSITAQTDAILGAVNGYYKSAPLTNVNLTSTNNWVAIKAGIPIISPDGFVITGITLISGSIAVY